MENSYPIILAVLLGALAGTVPVFMALFFTGLLGLSWLMGIDPRIVIEVLYRSMDKFALIVVLFFVFGSVANYALHNVSCPVLLF
ncbi:MAG: hypothetical protein RBT64_14710 [Trichloromonas sp.]|jgi:C4-dicarboxylate transporter DctM subunit|nr:hypothetical protein [Trichloromonas sp.]